MYRLGSRIRYKLSVSSSDGIDLCGLEKGDRVYIKEDRKYLHGTVSSLAQKPEGILVRVKLDGNIQNPVRRFPIKDVHRI